MPDIDTSALGQGAGTYLSAAEQAADNAGVPRALFVALVQQESGFNSTAVGSSNDYGLAQLTPVIYGHPNSYNENGTLSAFVPQQNLQIGANYLADMYKKFGNWTDALDAYNAGETAVRNKTNNNQAYAISVMSIATRLGWSGAGNTVPNSNGDASQTDPNSVWSLVANAINNIKGGSANTTADAAVANAGSAATAKIASWTGIPEEIDKGVAWLKEHLIIVLVGLLALGIMAYSAFGLIPAHTQETIKSTAKIAALV